MFRYIDLLDKLRRGEMFSFSRFGDGEWNAIAQDRKDGAVNCDGHRYFADMGARLRQSLKDWDGSDSYHLGLQSLAYKQRPKMIDAITAEYGLRWSNSNILHRANIENKLDEMYKALQGRDVVIIGGGHLSGFDAVEHHLIEIPRKNCWLAYDTTSSYLRDLIHPDMVVLLCASMMSNVIIADNVHKCTLIDCGSIFDIHVGVRSRGYMRKM